MESRTEVCSAVEEAFNLLGRKWAGLIIHVLASGPRRFSEIERAIPGVSGRMLTQRIKELETAGILARTVHIERPVRVRYDLTDRGRALIPVMRGIERWAQSWITTPAAASGA